MSHDNDNSLDRLETALVSDGGEQNKLARVCFGKIKYLKIKST